MRDLGIKKIYFNPDKKDPVSGNITASVGFEREENGKTITGSSVDWFTQGAEKKLELLLRQNFSNQSSELKEINKTTATKESSYGEFSPSDITKRSGPLTGVWKWTFVNEHSKELAGNDGFFVIQDDKIDGISGFSMVESQFGDGKKVASAVLRFAIKGSKTITSKGQEVQFTTETGNGNTVTNIAKILDENTLVGESKAVVNDQNGTKKAISYKWIATKYEK